LCENEQYTGPYYQLVVLGVSFCIKRSDGTAISRFLCDDGKSTKLLDYRTIIIDRFNLFKILQNVIKHMNQD